MAGGTVARAGPEIELGEVRVLREERASARALTSFAAPVTAQFKHGGTGCVLPISQTSRECCEGPESSLSLPELVSGLEAPGPACWRGPGGICDGGCWRASAEV